MGKRREVMKYEYFKMRATIGKGQEKKYACLKILNAIKRVAASYFRKSINK